MAVSISPYVSLQYPAAFDHYLAMSLNSLGNTLYGLGRSEDAAVAFSEAVDIYRELAERHPAAFGSQLTASRHNLAMVVSKLAEEDVQLDDLGLHAKG